MRCLYCGNELALLKRLTGHGEFCSEAHRQNYQEQHNRLALTRLLQAQGGYAERRLLQISARPDIGSRGSVNAGVKSKQLPPPAPNPVPPRGSKYPDLSGFLLHHFEPALSPAELFSSEPFLAAVTACLPSAAVFAPRFAIAAGELPVYRITDSGVARDVIAHTPEARAHNGLKLLNGDAPVPLELQRIDSLPIPDASAQCFLFHPEFDQTMAGLLTLIEENAQQRTAELPRFSAPAPANGSNGSSDYGKSEPPTRTTSSTAVPPRFEKFSPGVDAAAAVETPQGGAEESAEAAPDDVLFEEVVESGEVGPAVVINLDALTREFWAPASTSSGVPAPIVVADTAEARRLFGWLDDEVPAAEPEPAQSVQEAIQTEVAAEVAAPVTEILQPETDEVPAQPAVLETEEPAVVAQVEHPPELIAEPSAEQQVNVAEPETVVPAVAAAPRQIIPAVCLEFIDIHLELADDAFAPISENEFSGPEFATHTPAITTAPLRVKVVFDPNPESAKRPEIGGSEPLEEMETRPDHDLRVAAQRTDPRNEIAAPQPPVFVTSRKARSFEDAVAPVPPPAPVAGAAQTAARLRSMAALARKAQQDLSGPERPVEPVAPQVRRPRVEPEPPPPPRRDTGLESLRLEMERMGAALATSPLSRRIAVIVGLLLAVLLAGYLMKQPFASKPAPKAQSSRLEAYGPPLGSGDTGWSLDWAGQNTTGLSPAGRFTYSGRHCRSVITESSSTDKSKPKDSGVFSAQSTHGTTI